MDNDYLFYSPRLSVLNCMFVCLFVYPLPQNDITIYPCISVILGTMKYVIYTAGW